MFRRTLTLVAGCAALAGAAVFVPAAGAASDNGATKGPLVIGGQPFCNGSGFNVPPVGPQEGFEIVKQNGDGTVSGTVSLKNASANTLYTVWLIQIPSGAGCNVPVPAGTLETNGQGNGNAHVDATEEPGTTGAFIFLFPGPGAPISSYITGQFVTF